MNFDDDIIFLELKKCNAKIYFPKEYEKISNTNLIYITYVLENDNSILFVKNNLLSNKINKNDFLNFHMNMQNVKTNKKRFGLYILNKTFKNKYFFNYYNSDISIHVIEEFDTNIIIDNLIHFLYNNNFYQYDEDGTCIMRII